MSALLLLCLTGCSNDEEDIQQTNVPSIDSLSLEARTAEDSLGIAYSMFNGEWKLVGRRWLSNKDNSFHPITNNVVYSYNDQKKYREVVQEETAYVYVYNCMIKELFDLHRNSLHCVIQYENEKDNTPYAYYDCRVWGDSMSLHYEGPDRSGQDPATNYYVRISKESK